MNNHIITEYQGAYLEISAFLVPLLPLDLPLRKWPTFCGPGSGLGDRLVPDFIGKECIAYIQIACLQHDLDWALADGSREDYERANMRFLRNLRSLVRTQIDDEEVLDEALWDCEVYYMFVASPIGYGRYKPTGPDPATNPVVREKLRRLARRKPQNHDN